MLERQQQGDSQMKPDAISHPFLILRQLPKVFCGLPKIVRSMFPSLDHPWKDTRPGEQHCDRCDAFRHHLGRDAYDQVEWKPGPLPR